MAKHWESNSRTSKSRKPYLDPVGLTFSVFSLEEITKLSVVKITTPLSFNVLGHALSGGLYDPAMGPLNEHSNPCTTCFKNVFCCPGHMGHIEIPLPVVNPLFYKSIAILIKLSCLNCHSFQLPGHVKALVVVQLNLLDEGLVAEAQEVEIMLHDITSEASLSDNVLDCMVQERLKIFMESIHSEKSCEQKSDANKLYSTKNVEAMKNSIINGILQQISDYKICPKCKSPSKKLFFFQNKIMTSSKRVDVAQKFESKKKQVHGKSKQELTMIMPDSQRDHLRDLWQKDPELITALAPVLKLRTVEHPTDLLFLQAILVAPPKTRPVNLINNKLVEHAQSQVYKLIIQDGIVINHIANIIQVGSEDHLSAEGKAVVSQVRGDSYMEKLHRAYQELQSNVDHLMDSSMNQTTGGMNTRGIKQVIEKKEGVIRMHMMGKRVNFAARSVITPDPNLNIDEIGIPEQFALTLTYPVPVTAWNVAELRKMVINGPIKHPGAVTVENEDGSLNRISPDDKVQRESVAKRLLTPGVVTRKSFKGVKVVHRHLCNGDVLLLNRQPTLHRPSIMAHTARVLKGEKALRLHYANCKAYNADFDGDEMNAHFPQSELGRSEAYTLLSVCNQYLVPKDGTPLSGLIQDHVVSGVRLSVRGKLFSREDYMQLVYQALGHMHKDITILRPAIVKPMKLWTGKQVISTVIINITPKGKTLINLVATSKISSKAWESAPSRPWKAGGTPFTNSNTMTEAEVIIRQGELLCGVLDKKHYGATPYGLVHCLYELYGGTCSAKLLSSFSKLFTAFLQREGFTLGVEDILVVTEADTQRTYIVNESRQVGEKAAASGLECGPLTLDELRQKVEEVNRSGIMGKAMIDRGYKTTLDTFTNNINRVCLPAGLLQKFPDNNLQLMIESGAKGSTVNSMQISCLLGQIELEGKRPPVMTSGKSLPSFAPFDISPRAGGFIDGRFMTGIQPQEFFFHCMAGREGLIDTAVKTSRSGYLQRCLIKHLEGLVVNYDMTVRDSDGRVIQFCYGEDGRDVVKAQFLRKEQIPFLAENCHAIADKKTIKDMKERCNCTDISQKKTEIQIWQQNGFNSSTRMGPFLMFCNDRKRAVVLKSPVKLKEGTGRSLLTNSVIKSWRKLDAPTVKNYKKMTEPCPDPVTADYQADRDFGSLTEHLEELITDYVLSQGHATKFQIREFSEMMFLKSMMSLSPPGEPVGLLAAQSIGEPSTQMTLNTFHFAGRGEMNVTLGIPRLREILMIASKSMKTPSMEIPFISSLHHLSKRAEKLRKKLTRVTLTDVLEYVTITDQLEIHPVRQTTYDIMFKFLPHHLYEDEFSVKPEDILKHVETKFISCLLMHMKKRFKFKGTVLASEAEKSTYGTVKEDEFLDETVLSHEVSDELTARAKKSGVGEDHESSDEDLEAEDEDATQARSRNRHVENQEYQDPEDGEEIPVFDEDNNAKEEGSELKINVTIEDDLFSKIDDSEDSDETEDEEMNEEGQYFNGVQARHAHVISIHTYVKDYEYDVEEELWCKLKLGIPLVLKKIDLSTLLKDIAKQSVIWEIPHIRRAFVNYDGEMFRLKTDGINIVEIFKFNELLELNKLYSNDVYGVSQVYGIEAARRVLIKEIQNVFKMYGIVIDARHLLLVADYMTFNGTFEPFNRKAMEDSSSPIQQMSFEASLTFLKSATLQGKHDTLRSPSSRLMVGRPCAGGTGAISLLHSLPLPQIL